MNQASTKRLQPFRQHNRGAQTRLALLVVTWALMTSPGTAAPALRIATWDVSQAEKSIFSRKKAEKKSSWRHTFGSERRDAKKTRLGVFNLDVDIVLLQGVRNVRALRRVFPTRHWKLILSKDYMRYAPPLSRLPSDLQAYDISVTGRTVEHPVTAIAVRYQRRLRVRAIKHIRIKDHVVNSRDGLAQVDLNQAPSATAVRINHFGTNIWLMSLALLQDCHGAVADCPTWKALNNWYRLLNASDHGAAIAGTSHTSKSDPAPGQAQPPKCGTLAPLTQACSAESCLGQSKSLTRKKLGCIVLSTMRLPPAGLRQPASAPSDF